SGTRNDIQPGRMPPRKPGRSRKRSPFACTRMYGARCELSGSSTSPTKWEYRKKTGRQHGPERAFRIEIRKGSAECLGEHSSVYMEYLTRYIIRQVGGQIQAGIGHIPGRTAPFKRNGIAPALNGF